VARAADATYAAVPPLVLDQRYAEYDWSVSLIERRALIGKRLSQKENKLLIVCAAARLVISRKRVIGISVAIQLLPARMGASVTAPSGERFAKSYLGALYRLIQEHKPPKERTFS
jgi:hypothetical protein